MQPGNANLLIGVAKTANREIGVPRSQPSRIVIPLADNSLSNCATAGVTSPSPGTTTAHSRSSRKARVTMLQLRK